MGHSCGNGPARISRRHDAASGLAVDAVVRAEVTERSKSAMERKLACLPWECGFPFLCPHFLSGPPIIRYDRPGLLGKLASSVPDAKVNKGGLRPSGRGAGASSRLEKLACRCNIRAR
jgi:hypothetical protein